MARLRAGLSFSTPSGVPKQLAHMPNVTFEKTGNVTGRIVVNITKEELNEKLVVELKKQRGKTSMKGFRKGKTPMSTLRKMMGNQILGNILDDEIRESLFGHIEDNDIKLIFSPVPVDNDQPMITATTLADLNMEYALALEPEFDLNLPTEPFTKYVLNTDKAFIDEQVNSMLKRGGENSVIEDGKVENEDILDVTIAEVGPMDDGISHETKLYVDSLSDAGKKKLTGKKVGAVIKKIDLTNLEKDSSATYINKYLLGLEDDSTDISGKTFSLTINTISRITPAEMNEEFFVKFDASGAVKTEEQLREKIVEDNASGFAKQGESMANFEIQRALVENHDIELPTEMMQKMHAEEPNGSYDMFERGVRWMLIRNKFAAENEVKLEYADIKAEALESLLGMLGGQRPDFLTDEFVDNYVKQMLDDEKQREQLSSNAIEKKIMAAIRDKSTFNEKAITAEDFNDIIKSFNEDNTPPGEE
jgi:trigger factor